jgi:predicted dinucleotide-utilizing enzyme
MIPSVITSWRTSVPLPVGEWEEKKKSGEKNRKRKNALHPPSVDSTALSGSAPDLIIEVAHPAITEAYGAALLKVSDVLFGSPTAFASAPLEAELRAIANAGPHTLWVPAGALWGALDIQKMADRGSLHVGDARLNGCDSSSSL